MLRGRSAVRIHAPSAKLALSTLAIALATSGGLVNPPAPKAALSPVPYMPDLVAAATTRIGVGDGSHRPAYRRDAPDGVDRVSAPAVALGDIVAVKHSQWHDAPLPHLYPSQQLPYRYYVERELAEQFGLDAIIDGMAAWDGIPGSRWATEFAGVVTRVDRRRGDGMSVVYRRTACPDGWLGYAARNYAHDTAFLDARYGSAAIYSAEVDIGICPRVRDAEKLKATLAHEVGHAMGLGHLCATGHACDKEAQAPECRPMWAVVRPCGGVSAQDQLAARHLHPTLPRLAGPSAMDTAARVSYATTPSESAGTVVIAPAGPRPRQQVLAAALSGFVDGPLLLAEPDDSACIIGPARVELIRVARRAAKVLLVGEWPERCEEVLGGWNLHVERFSGGYAVRMAIAVADRIAASGRMQDTATVVSYRADDAGLLPGGIPAAATAYRGPLLFSHPGRLSRLVGEWLEEHPQIRRVFLMGSLTETDQRLVRELRAMGLEVVRVGGGDAVHTALAVAEHPDLVPDGGPAVVASGASLSDGAVAAALAARLRAPLVLSGPVPDTKVEDLFRSRAPEGGYLVGGADALPWELQWAYSELVAAAENPVPRRDDRAGRILLQSAVQHFFPNHAGD